MTVAELVARLQEVPQDYKVMLDMDYGPPDELIDITVVDRKREVLL